MAGKGSSPRSCFSKDFKNNYDQINWGHKTPWDKFSDELIEKYPELDNLSGFNKELKKDE